MTAHRDDSAGTGAVVRKPPVKEPAGREAPTCRPGYGDLTAVMGLGAGREGAAVGSCAALEGRSAWLEHP